MDIYLLYIIAYATSITSSLGSCAILLFLNHGNVEINPTYLKAWRILALASSLVAIGLTFQDYESRLQHSIDLMFLPETADRKIK